MNPSQDCCKRWRSHRNKWKIWLSRGIFPKIFLNFKRSTWKYVKFYSEISEMCKELNFKIVSSSFKSLCCLRSNHYATVIQFIDLNFKFCKISFDFYRPMSVLQKNQILTHQISVANEWKKNKFWKLQPICWEIHKNFVPESWKCVLK